MAADGSDGPKPYTQRRASTVFLRVPAAEWPYVSRGQKTEFRAASGQVSGLKFVEPPTPVVAYRERRGQYESKLMVLEARWQEPLGAITPESLAREGFESIGDFRRHWMRRERRRFTPLRHVTVYRVRLWNPGDEQHFAEKLFRHLYDSWL